MIEIRDLSPGLLLALMAIVWISDSSAFFTGRAWGRNKLAPEISPGKTWEGVYGALAAVLVYAIICIVTFGQEVIPDWFPGEAAGLLVAVFWLALAFAGIMGDLMESLLKRMAGVKDSGMLLPGHGGILDRIDALLPILPIAAIFYLR
jgi:phosphatidate cytidylyltransferase